MSNRNWNFYVRGQFHEPQTKQWIDSFNPTTGMAWANVPPCADTRPGRAVATQAVAREEVFAPVRAVLPIDDEDQAAGIWRWDSARTVRIAHRIGAGTINYSDDFASAPQSPVRGYLAPGNGRDNGLEGLLAFTQIKSVWFDLPPWQEVPFA